MNNYSSLRQQNKAAGPVVSLLILCVVLSASMLLSRLAVFAALDTRLYIPLTESDGITTVREGIRDAQGGISFRDDSFDRANHLLLTAKPGIRVYDENTVWSGETDVEIFKISYQNGSGKVTVASGNGEKVIAPGTENTYEFALENTGNVALDYTVTMEAWFGTKGDPEAIRIPVLARVTDYKGNYLLGTAEAKADVLGLNDVKQSASLGVSKVAPYTLEWEWPFETDDAYDTWLGNLAAQGEDITLTIKIMTTATYSADPDNDDGIPKTGDDSQILVFGTLMSVSAVLLLILLLPKRKQEESHG